MISSFVLYKNANIILQNINAPVKSCIKSVVIADPNNLPSICTMPNIQNPIIVNCKLLLTYFFTGSSLRTALVCNMHTIDSAKTVPIIAPTDPIRCIKK